MLHHVQWIIAVLLVGLTACGNATDVPLAEPVIYDGSGNRSDFTTYSDEKYPFSVQLPSEWYVGQLSGDEYGILAASSNDPAQPRAAISIVVEQTDGSPDLQQAATAAEETLSAQQGISDFRLELARQATINGTPGHERTYRYTFEQQVMQQRTVYISGVEHLYALSLIAPQAIFAQNEVVFADVLASFEGA